MATLSREERVERVYEESKRRDIASFVQDGKVNWQRWHNLRGSDRGTSYNDELRDLRGSDRGTSYNDELREGVINHLVDIGILSFNPEGNHRVAGGGLNLNPRFHICQTYFTSREQARSYVNACFSRAHYEVRIEKLSDIEVMRQV